MPGPDFGGAGDDRRRAALAIRRIGKPVSTSGPIQEPRPNPEWKYRLVSRLVHQPRLLRFAASALQRKPSFARLARVVSGRDTVNAVFQRTLSFSSAANAPNLRAGEFVIGMDSDLRHHAEREMLKRILPSPGDLRLASIEHSQRAIATLRKGDSDRFDLIEHMAGVAWGALGTAFGPAAAQIAGSDPANPGLPSRDFITELRTLGAHLIIGGVAPDKVRRDADAKAARLNQRVHGQLQQLAAQWGLSYPGDAALIQRNAVGLMWVSHPATVQACALLMQELFGRRDVLDCLAKQAQELDDMAWSDAGFRKRLKDHVLELLRFRPPFPILVRNVPRDTWFDVGAGFPAGHATAGSQINLLTIGAMFDDAAMMEGEAGADAFKPGRKFKVDEDRYMMFGMGARACIAKYQVVEILVSALAGLLALKRLRWARPWFGRMDYDGPTITGMWLKFDR
jgi:cytochrome P450